MAETESQRAALILRGRKTGAWRLDLDNPKEIERMLGRDLLVAFAKCFVGSDRLVSLTHLYILSVKHGGPEGSHLRLRDAALINLLLIGTLHELSDAMSRLGQAMRRSGRQHVPSWGKLTKIRRRWAAMPAVSKIRNELAHHLGHDDVYAKGLEVAQRKRSMSLYQADGPKGWRGTFSGAWSLVIAGLDLEPGEYREVSERVADDVAEVPRVLIDAFRDVVNAAGIPVEDQRAD